ncbi:MAG: type II toxin-antitoxin system PemK/MazF family toxin [Actinobacteria bacterium]|nr:type II toxin-antitoxin system PemK/MazF family toxin [Actinomycetota bacterium]
MRRGLIGQLLDGLQQILRPTRSRSTSSKRGPAGGDRSGATDVRDRDLAFEYSPCLDGDPDPGEVVWTWVPYEDDPSQGKDRPVAIIGRRGSHLLGVPLTSKEKHNEIQVPIGTGSWDREGRVSYAKVERVLEIVPTSVRREGAVLSRAHYDDIVAGVERARRRGR